MELKKLRTIDMQKTVATPHGLAILGGSLLLAIFLISHASKSFDQISIFVADIVPAHSQVAQVSASLTTGLVAHYTFDEGSGTTAGDSAGSNTGTLTNYPVWDSVNPKIGSGSMNFDGVDDYVSTGITGNLGQKVTISTWVKFNKLVGNRDVIVGSRYYSDNNFVLEQHSVSGMLFFTSGSGHYVQWTPGFTTGQWYHIVLVVDTTQTTDAEKVKLYMNGVLKSQLASAAIGTDSITATLPIVIGGANLPGNSYFSGGIDDVRIYNRALSPSEVQDLYSYQGPIVETPISVPDTTVVPAVNDPNLPPQNNTEWYVSPSGVYSNTGTINSPWDLQFALKGANGAIKPGHTLWIRAGTYTGIDQVNYANVLGKKFFVSKLSGTEQAPIIVRNYHGERVTINGSIESSGPWTTFWGLEIMNSDSTNRTGCPIDRQGGMSLVARGDKAINMIIHDAGHPGIGFWNPVGDGGELYGNILWANGIYDICDGGTPQKPNTRGSGFYMQNNSGTRYIHDNISFWEFTTGMKAYGQDTDGFDFQGNVTFNNPTENIFVTANGNTTKRLKLISNFTFQERDKAAGNIGLGIYFPGIYDPGVDVVIQNNYFATGDIIPWPDKNGNYPAFALDIKDFSDVTVTGNKIVGGGLAGLLITNRLTKLNWNNNAYYTTRTASPNFPFYFQDARGATIQRISQFFSDWKNSCNCDSNSTYNTGLPTTNDIFVRPNKYEQGRAHIIVYNWQGLSSVKVDVSNILAPGDTYEVRDAQNYFGTSATQGTYSGGEVTVPMNQTTVSIPLGNIVATPTHTSSQFGAFVLIRTASGGNQPNPTPSSQSTVNPIVPATPTQTSQPALPPPTIVPTPPATQPNPAPLTTTPSTTPPTNNIVKVTTNTPLVSTTKPNSATTQKISPSKSNTTNSKPSLTNSYPDLPIPTGLEPLPEFSELTVWQYLLYLLKSFNQMIVKGFVRVFSIFF